MRVKFTPQVIEKIKEFVAEGISREEIASRLGVTVGSLQVTCSKSGISLRRHVRIAHVGEQKEVSQPEAKFAITMRYRGKEQTADIPLSPSAIETLALEATSRDVAFAELLGQILVAAVNKDMIHEILRD
jgi:hypothetical protein